MHVLRIFAFDIFQKPYLYFMFMIKYAQNYAEGREFNLI